MIVTDVTWCKEVWAIFYTVYYAKSWQTFPQLSCLCWRRMSSYYSKTLNNPTERDSKKSKKLNTGPRDDRGSIIKMKFIQFHFKLYVTDGVKKNSWERSKRGQFALSKDANLKLKLKLKFTVKLYLCLISNTPSRLIPCLTKHHDMKEYGGVEV
jgi:hypothetical protein